MGEHFHTDIVAVLTAGISAIIVIHLIRFAATPLAKRNDMLGTVGKAMGGLVTY